jgi:hypothetical protein
VLLLYEGLEIHKSIVQIISKKKNLLSLDSKALKVPESSTGAFTVKQAGLLSFRDFQYQVCDTLTF